MRDGGGEAGLTADLDRKGREAPKEGEEYEGRHPRKEQVRYGSAARASAHAEADDERCERRPDIGPDDDADRRRRRDRALLSEDDSKPRRHARGLNERGDDRSDQDRERKRSRGPEKLTKEHRLAQGGERATKKVERKEDEAKIKDRTPEDARAEREEAQHRADHDEERADARQLERDEERRCGRADMRAKEDGEAIAKRDGARVDERDGDARDGRRGLDDDRKDEPQEISAHARLREALRQLLEHPLAHLLELAAQGLESVDKEHHGRGDGDDGLKEAH